MKWGIVLLTLIASFSVYAEPDTALTLALNEPDELSAQRQSAVERLHKLLKQKSQGIKPIAELPVSVPKAKPTDTKAAEIIIPVKKTHVAKAVDSKVLQVAKKKSLTKKKINIAVVAWGGALIDDHHFERLMSDQRLAISAIHDKYNVRRS